MFDHEIINFVANHLIHSYIVNIKEENLLTFWY